MQHATNCVAQIIIDKTEKHYFHLDQPVTLAISFALPRNIFALVDNIALVSFIKENIERTIKNLLPNHESIHNINCAIKTFTQLLLILVGIIGFLNFLKSTMTLLFQKTITIHIFVFIIQSIHL